MRLLDIHHLIDAGGFTKTAAWQRIESEIREAITAVVWPPGNDRFTINPRRMGNGVKPIKEGFVAKLVGFGWKSEQRYPRRTGEFAARLPGKFDAMLDLASEGLAPF